MGGRSQEPQQPPPSAEGPLAKDTWSLLTPSCYLSGEGSIRTPKASAFPTPLRCCSLLQSSFTNTISQKGLDLCPLSFRIITWQLEKAALPSDVGLSLPLPCLTEFMSIIKFLFYATIFVWGNVGEEVVVMQ